MSWSWRVGRIAGIDLYVHFTFVFLLAWVVMVTYNARGNPVDAVLGVAFIIALFGIVVLHELGHALAARRYGVPTRDITLLPIGGVARLERMPEDPKQELVIALAGPAVNVVLAAALFVGLGLGSALRPPATTLLGGDFLNQLLWINVFLAVFNLLPAFPMDGGRVLRALLAMRLDYVQATQLAATIGQAMAVLFVLAGLFLPNVNPFLILIGVFVWLGAAGEASMVQMRTALGGIPVKRAMVTDFRTLSPDDPLSKGIDYLLAGFQQDFPVVEGDRLVGLVTRSRLAEELPKLGKDARVGEIAATDFVTAHPREMLQSAFARLQDCRCHTLPVVEGDVLVGLLTADNLAEVLMFQQAIAGKRRRGQARAGLADGDPRRGEGMVPGARPNPY